jgi:rhamnose transport system permease protein
MPECAGTKVGRRSVTGSSAIAAAIIPKTAAHEPLWLRREALLGFALLILVLAMGGVTGGQFLSPDNLRDIAINTSIPLVMAAGMTALIIAAQIDISIGPMLAVCAVSIAILANKGVPVPALLLIGVGLGAALGSVNGLLTAGLKIPSIVATLATMGAMRGILVLVTKGDTIAVPDPLRAIGSGALLGVSNLVWAAAMVSAATGLYLARTRRGRQHYAVGSNPRSAALSGVPVGWVTFRSFVLLGALVGAAGFLYVCQYTPIESRPQPGIELLVITAVVVGGTDIFGGRGTMMGTVLAALLLTTIGVSLTFLGSKISWLRSEIQPAVQGLLILAAVFYNSLSRREGTG